MFSQMKVDQRDRTFFICVGWKKNGSFFLHEKPINDIVII